MDAVIAFSRFDPMREAELFREFAYKMKVDGIILFGGGKDIRNPDEIPLVIFSGSSSTSVNADVIKTDLMSGIVTLLQTIKSMGHTEIGFIGEPLTKGKQKIFLNSLRQVGLPVREEFIVTSKKRFMEAGEDGMRTLIARNALPSVIIAAYDQIALGAMHVAVRHGYRIPDDISFAGIDDITPSSYLDVPLTSLRVDFESVADKVIELILSRIENPHRRSQAPITVPVEVIVRDSLKKTE